MSASSLPANVVELLQTLVRVPSVNPEGTSGVENPGEAACADAVAGFLRVIGARVEMQTVLPDRPNVVGVFPSNAPGKKRVVFAPHTDTVSVVGMTIDPFSGEERDGKIWGRGASDTKGPMAAMLWALWEMRDRLPALGHEIWFTGLMGEEAGQFGAKAFVDRYKMDFALIGEPTNLGIVHAHKGSCWLTLTTSGKAVHASTPERGENAVYKMMDVIRHLREVTIPRWRALPDPVLGSPTISVGTIQGGSKTNIVPDSCQVTVDCRTIPDQDDGTLADNLIAELRGVCPDLKAEFSQSRPLSTNSTHPLIAALVRAGGHRATAPWFCDAAVFDGAGVPAVAAGPGFIAQAHTRDEWISIDDLRQGVEFYKNFLQQL